MENQTGIVESLIDAVSKALVKGTGRKNIVAIVAMFLLSTMADASLWLCIMVMAVAVVAILTQWALDAYEVKTTGEDLPDNGAGIASEVNNEMVTKDTI